MLRYGEETVLELEPLFKKYPEFVDHELIRYLDIMIFGYSQEPVFGFPP